jgi:sulfatase modifying factor 1
MMRRPLLLLLLGALLAGACTRTAPPRVEQYTITVTTDGPLPRGPEEDPSLLVTEPLFDRVHIGVYPPGAPFPCPVDCDRDVPVDRVAMQRGEVSFGVTADQPTEVRIELYLERFSFPFVPTQGVAIDAWISLDALPAGTLERRTVILHTKDVGVLADRHRPLATTAAPADPSLPGSWPLATPVPCTTAGGAGQLCVEGGAFYRGSIRYYVGSTPSMVVLAPFWLDTHEVTVRELRQSGLARVDAGTGIASDPSSAAGTACTYTVAPGPNDDLPVTCVSATLAETYCASSGSVLPTAAQFEFAASARRGNDYVWGNDPPSCDDAVWGRASSLSIFDAPNTHDLKAATCLVPATLGAPLAPGSGLRDRLRVAGGEIVDLAGNVAEWTADQANDACLADMGLRIDPHCDVAGPSAGKFTRAVRGGTFASSQKPLVSAYTEEAAPSDSGIDTLGFRCARAGR